GSLFREKASTTETPTIRVTNLEDDLMTLTLRDAAGHVTQAQSRSGRTTTILEPPGEYSVDVTSNDPLVQPNSGDAVFRRYKAYDATFAWTSDPTPLHLGDR